MIERYLGGLVGSNIGDVRFELATRWLVVGLRQLFQSTLDEVDHELDRFDPIAASAKRTATEIVAKSPLICASQKRPSIQVFADGNKQNERGRIVASLRLGEGSEKDDLQSECFYIGLCEAPIGFEIIEKGAKNYRHFSDGRNVATAILDWILIRLHQRFLGSGAWRHEANSHSRHGAVQFRLVVPVKGAPIAKSASRGHADLVVRRGTSRENWRNIRTVTVSTPFGGVLTW